MKHFFTALLCIFFTVNALAADVTKNNAAKVATNYFSEVLISNEINREVAISETFNITKEGNTVLYVFNFENGGFVIVSADDRFTPIVGYSPDGFYQQDNMPDGFEFLMEEFSEMIVFIREQNIAATPEYTAKWERYESDQPHERGIAGAIVIAPLTALWNQDSPYNYYCPTIGSSGGKTVTGCVATAMSLIMYYWRWPWEGTDKQNPYRPPQCNGQQMDTLSANFGDTYYDYNGMYGTPTITADGYLYKPLALLQYHAGVSVKMQYCSESGAHSDNVPPAVKKYFKYDESTEYIERKDYANTEAWVTMMKEQLDLKQPVYVSGRSSSGGHAFICDGYDTDNKFHYNFGWSGHFNSYFVADKPGEFTSEVAAIINFVPDRSQGYPIDCNGQWTLTHPKGMLADCSSPAENYAKGITATWLLDPSANGDGVENITISCNKIDLAIGDYLTIYDGETDSAPQLGEFTGKEPFEPVTSTGSKVLVKFTTATDSPTADGFLITYETKFSKYCTGDVTYTAANGTFTDGSPEEMNYPNSASCKWYIKPTGAVEDAEITIKFNRLDTEAGADAIKIYDYYHNVMTPKAIISGTDIPEPITIKTKELMITFTSNSYINGKGFEITYTLPNANIKEVENINDLAIYPNPASDKVNVNFNTSTPDNFDITIYNVTGQVVYKETLNNFIGNYHNELNIADFAQGVYLMNIKSSKGAATRKVVVQ